MTAYSLYFWVWKFTCVLFHFDEVVQDTNLTSNPYRLDPHTSVEQYTQPLIIKAKP